MAKQVDFLSVRDQHTFSSMTVEQWRSYAGQVLAIDPKTDRILAVASSESEFDGRDFGIPVVEFFSVPERGALAKR